MVRSSARRQSPGSASLATAVISRDLGTSYIFMASSLATVGANIGVKSAVRLGLFPYVYLKCMKLY